MSSREAAPFVSPPSAGGTAVDRPENNAVAATTHEVVERPYTDRSDGTRETMNEARAGTVVTDRRLSLERALVPALLGGIFVIAGWFAVHVSAQTRELRAEMGNVRSELGEVKGRLDGVDQRLDGLDRRLDGVDQRIESLRDDMNERFERIEDRMGRIEALLMEQRPPPTSGP